MDKKIAGLLGAAAALSTIGAAQAAAPAQTQTAPATAYRDLLNPIPNAAALLKADNGQREQGQMKVADTVVIKHKRHHHHHHHHVVIVHHHHDHD
jgi:hypothetical protein